MSHSAFSCHGEGKSINPGRYRCLTQQVEFCQFYTTIALTHSNLQLETRILLLLVVVVATAEAARVSKSELPHHLSAIRYGYGESGSRGLGCGGVPCYRYINFRGHGTPTRKLTKRSPVLLPNPAAAIKALHYTVKGGLVFLFPPAWGKLPGIIAKALSSAVLATG